MYEAKKEHLVYLFDQFSRRLPPLVPESLKANLMAANERAKTDDTLTVEGVEAELIYFAKQLWPYRRAFLDMYQIEREHMGETFFLQGLPRSLKKKYQSFTMGGGTYRDLRLGRHIDHFTLEERQELYPVFVSVDQQLFDYTRQRAVSIARMDYLAAVGRYEAERERLSFLVHRLQDMAIETELKVDQPAEGLWSDVRALEYGVSLLGPEISAQKAETLVEEASAGMNGKYFN